MRLIDLHCNWALQYAAETSQYDASFYPEIAAKAAQVDGYLMGTSLAFLACGRAAGDWERQADPWLALASMIDRYEAEFAGRLVATPDDVDRWRAEADLGLCWGLLGVSGFDRLVRSPADLDRLAPLFERGVRLYQPVETADGVLGGSSDADDARGLSDLGRAFLERLLDLAPPAGKPGPRPLLDLAHMNAPTCADVLAWFEHDETRANRLPLLHSHGSIDGLGPDFPGRFRALGGVIGLSVGPPAVESAEALRSRIEALAASPFRGQTGYEGIGVGTDYLELDATVAGLGEVEKVAEWLSKVFSPGVAALLGFQNARRLVEAAAGARI
ncbi:MAG: membrane dipeptidase [Paludisphaera borealis]|uniref:membrane dipeptidase n=1 Tax=Paludisphaera borealis TaxID=1387353 RepID=UPI00284361FA|nr:membrane dipeptidase [Paludisphaera borealis]MDR3622539.1 membrane dipeptidase [Paludisphaera borealis]